MLHVLITAGGTREYIDPVRFISNASSGRMGYALARAAVKAGHKVTLISAETSLRPPKDVKIVHIETSKEMFEAVKSSFGKCDCLIMAAAVSDYKPAAISRAKIKKAQQGLVIKLKPAVDILKWAGKNKKDKIIVGFALEDKNLRKNAEEKLAEKNIDMIIANAPSAIGSKQVQVQIKTPNLSWQKLSAGPKSTIASRIIKLIERL